MSLPIRLYGHGQAAVIEIPEEARIERRLDLNDDRLTYLFSGRYAPLEDLLSIGRRTRPGGL